MKSPQNLTSNEFWGRKSGGFSTYVPKGHKKPIGNCFTQSQWGVGRENNTPKKRGLYSLKNRRAA